MESAGFSLSTVIREPERRFTTLLKFDLVNSTGLSHDVDLDEQVSVLRAFFEKADDCARMRGGSINHPDGDGALYSFSHPEAREDAASDAVFVALELVGIARGTRVESGRCLDVRVGVVSGSLAVGTMVRQSDGWRELLVGTLPSLAERLRTSAAPGGVVIDETTRELAGGFFDYESLGVLRGLKGFDHGVQAWRALGRTGMDSRYRAKRDDPSLREIVGRDDPLHDLMQSWLSAAAGKGQAVVLLGDAGYGKSKLARAVLDLALGQGASTLEIDCTPSAGNSPLYPIGVALRRLAGIGPQATGTQARALATSFLERWLSSQSAADAIEPLGALFGIQVEANPLPGPPELAWGRTVAEVATLLHGMALRGPPLVVLFEDLHWADATSWEVLRRLIACIGDCPMLLIGTARTLVDVAHVAGWHEIVLDRLQHDDAATLVKLAAGGMALPPELIEHIVERCDCVPLLLVEVTRNTLEAMDRCDGSEGVPLQPNADVPDELQIVVQARLGRWPRLKSIVQAASVLGLEFPVRMLEAMVPGRAGEVEHVVDCYRQHGLFAACSEPPDDRVRFKHELIRQAVYLTLMRVDTERLHALAADTLTAQKAEGRVVPADVVAQHLAAATRFAEAVDVRIEASVETAAHGAYSEAIDHCRQGLREIEGMKDARQRRSLEFRLLVQLGVAHTGRSGYGAAEAETAYRRAQELCGDSAEAEMLYPIMRGMTGARLVRGDLAEAHASSLLAIRLAERSNQPNFVLDALSMQAYTTLYYGHLQACLEVIDACLALYVEVDGHTLAYPAPQDPATAVLSLLPTVAWLTGDSKRSNEAIAQGLAHVERLDRPFDMAMLHAWIAGARYTQRRFVEASQHAHVAYATAVKHGFDEWLGVGGLMLALSQAALAASPESLTAAGATCKVFSDHGVRLNASYYHWGLARGFATAGQPEIALRMIADGFGCAQASGESRMNPELLILQAELEPDDARARGLLDQAIAQARDHGAVATALRGAIALVLRSDPDAVTLDEARRASRLLDAQDKEDYPSEPDWMRRLLAKVAGLSTARLQSPT